jgi:hypothetical protein
MSMNQLRQAMRAHQAFALMNGQFAVQARQGSKPRPYESTRITDQSRYEDAPAPTDDDMISKFTYLRSYESL